MKKEKPPVTYDTRYRYKLDMLEPVTIMLKWVGIFLLIGLAGVDLGEHQKKTIPLAFLVTIVMLVVCIITGGIEL